MDILKREADNRPKNEDRFRGINEFELFYLSDIPREIVEDFELSINKDRLYIEWPASIYVDIDERFAVRMYDGVVCVENSKVMVLLMPNKSMRIIIL